MQSPSKLNQTYTVEDDQTEASVTSDEQFSQSKFEQLPASPTRSQRNSRSPQVSKPFPSSEVTKSQFSCSREPAGDAASTLSVVQLQEIREAFQVLDRDHDGTVTRDDVADVMINLGMPIISILIKPPHSLSSPICLAKWKSFTPIMTTILTSRLIFRSRPVYCSPIFFARNADH